MNRAATRVARRASRTGSAPPLYFSTPAPVPTAPHSAGSKRMSAVCCTESSGPSSSTTCAFYEYAYNVVCDCALFIVSHTNKVDVVPVGLHLQLALPLDVVHLIIQIAVCFVDLWFVSLLTPIGAR